MAYHKICDREVLSGSFTAMIVRLMATKDTCILTHEEDD